MTKLNTAHEKKRRKDRSTLYQIVENDFATTVTTEWKSGLVIYFMQSYIHAKTTKKKQSINDVDKPLLSLNSVFYAHLYISCSQ